MMRAISIPCPACSAAVGKACGCRERINAAAKQTRIENAKRKAGVA